MIALAIKDIVPDIVPHQSASASSTFILPSNPAIVYVGRWDTSHDNVYISNWGGAYFKTAFTGQTIEIKLGAPTSLFVSIDNGSPVAYKNVDGIVNLTPFPLYIGQHTLEVSTGNENASIAFEGLALDTRASVKQPPLSSRIIEFIGDSITAGAKTTKYDLTSYAWLTAEQLHVQHTQIATSGICLMDHLRSPQDVGMETQFFKAKSPHYPNAPRWNFERYQPVAVVINLGTNDHLYHASDQAFQRHYVAFLENIRHVYPKADIFVLRTFLGFEETPTKAAVQEVNQLGDTHVYYIDTTGWITTKTSEYADRLHPSNKGQRIIARHLAPILSSYLNA